MPEYERVAIIGFGDTEPDWVTVCIDPNYDFNNDEDTRIFYYFESRDEFERAKTKTDEFEFQIVETEN